MTTRIALALPLMSLLALTACDTDAEPNDTDIPTDTEDTDTPDDSARTYQGQSDTSDEGLRTSSQLSSATTVQMSRVEDDGSTTAAGSAILEANGSFELETDDDGSADYYVFSLIDTSDTVIGSTVITSAEAASAAEGELTILIDGTTSVVAETWVALADRCECSDEADETWLEAHIDTDLAAEVHAADNASTADTDVLLEAMAEAMLTGQETREEYASDIGLSMDAQSWSELTASAHDEAGSFDTDFYSALDSALSAEGMSASERDELHAVSEAAIRSTLRAMIEENANASLSEVQAVLTSATELSAWAEAEGASYACQDFEGSSEATSTLAADLEAELNAMATAIDEGTDTEEAEEDFMANLTSSLETAIRTQLDGMADGGDQLMDELELNGALVGEARVEAILVATLEGITTAQANFESTLESQVDAEATAEDAAAAAVEAHAQLQSEVEAMVNAWSYDDSIDTETMTEVLVSVTGHFSATS